MVTDRLTRLTPEVLRPDQAALYEAIAGGPRAGGPQHFALTDEDGALHGPFGVMLHAPSLGGPLQELGAAVRYRTSLSDRIREIAILQVAVATRSQFEWFAHVRVGRAAGLTEAELAALAQARFSGADEAERAAAELCPLLLAEEDIPDDTYERLREALGEKALLELVVLVGYCRTLAGMLRVFAVR